MLATDPFLPLLQQGLALQKDGRPQDAEQAYRKVLQSKPDHPMALHLAGTVVAQQGRWAEAISLLKRSLTLHPQDPMAWNNLSVAMLDAGDSAGALNTAAKALALAPDYIAAGFSFGLASLAQRQYSDALRAFNRVVSQQPQHKLVWTAIWRAAAAVCDFAYAQHAADHVLRGLKSGDTAVTPFDALALADDPAMHLKCAEAASQKLQQQEVLVPYQHEKVRHPSRIKLAYLSADFHEHATAYLTAELFERHDRQRFEVIAVSFGPDDASPMRERLTQAFDQFWDVRSLSHEAVVQRMLDANVDIAIDLKGFTLDSRASILMRKPAPIVVNYLGYPGSMGSSMYDYLIGDCTVTPTEHAPYYAEQLVRMPESYQVNDTLRAVDASVPTREEEGLPPSGFVFAAFNAAYKITSQFFDVWMRLLLAVPGSVLWLISDHEEARRNLRARAVVLGVAPDRLVFARRVPLSRHLARHAHADILLDTLPINAHTTASDALWTGLPVVTCMGKAFAGRVAASLLHAVGLSELVTQSVPEYEALALRLALDPIELRRLRNHLLSVRSSAPLFDAPRFTRHLEAAFEHMYRRWQQGLNPQAFSVAELSPTATMSA